MNALLQSSIETGQYYRRVWIYQKGNQNPSKKNRQHNVQIEQTIIYKTYT